MTKLWGIRHARYWWLRRSLLRWFARYRGPGIAINPADWDYLEAVWRGER